MPESSRVTLITGASSGIGAEFARQLAARGGRLILVARRVQKLEELARSLESAAKVQVEVLPADLIEEPGLRKVEARIAAEANIDLLINNAGFGTLGKFYEADPEVQSRMHKLHILATLRLTRAALPGMVARRRGGIINVSSVAAFATTPGSVSYCATKAWVNRFSEALSLELQCAGSPVKVQALCPGFTYSEFHDVAGVDRKTIPHSMWLTAEAVVKASLEGLEKGKLIVVPGLLYRILVLLTQLTPRAWQHAALVRYARRTGRI